MGCGGSVPVHPAPEGRAETSHPAPDQRAETSRQEKVQPQSAEFWRRRTLTLQAELDSSRSELQDAVINIKEQHEKIVKITQEKVALQKELDSRKAEHANGRTEACAHGAVLWNTASSSVASVTAPRYARDAVGRVVVEDGLVRMQPHGSSLQTDALLKGATSALANAQQQLSNLAALSGGGVLGMWNSASSSVASVTAPRYARDAVGRVVVEDGLVRMQPHGSSLQTDALKGATSAMANAQMLFVGAYSQKSVS